MLLRNVVSIYETRVGHDTDDHKRSTEALLMYPDRTASLCPHAFTDNFSWSGLDRQQKCIISERSFVNIEWSTLVKAPCGSPLYYVVPYGQTELLQNQG